MQHEGAAVECDAEHVPNVSACPSRRLLAFFLALVGSGDVPGGLHPIVQDAHDYHWLSNGDGTFERVDNRR
jgi:hypothetical protein